MTLSDFYSSINESMDEVLGRLRMESRIYKYLGLFLSDPSFTELTAAFEQKDAPTAFRAAHTMKGVAANLGLNKLMATSSELTEDLRPGAFTDKSEALFKEVSEAYTAAISGIQKLQDDPPTFN